MIVEAPMPRGRRSPTGRPPSTKTSSIERRDSLPTSLIAATLPPLAAFAVQSLLWSAISPFAWFLFYPTLLISSWLGGLRGGVGATLTSAALVWWYFIPPERTLVKAEPRYLLSAAVFIAVGFAFSLFEERLRRALAASESANDRLNRLIREHRVLVALIENSSDFIGIADPDGKPVYLNPGGRRMVGLASDFPVETVRIEDCYPPGRRAFVSNVILPSMVEHGHWQGETCFRHWQTEEAIPVSDTHFMIRDPETGQLLGAGTITRDISELKRTRDQLEATNRGLQEAHEEVTRLYEKTKELGRNKNSMFANVSHELRTPLTLILGHTRRLLAAPEVADAARESLQVIERNARVLHHHVDDLLQVSRFEARKAKPEYADTDLARLLRLVAGSFETVADERNIALAIEAREELWAQVDPQMFQGIVTNLLSNAFKFTPSRGRVRVSLRLAGDERIVVEVGDSGPGIPVERRDAVFERFRQLDEGSRRRFGGTGLGLPIVRELVSLHGGSVGIGSAPEGGALFTVELPERAPPGVPVRPRAAAVAPSISRDEAEQVIEELRVRHAVAGPVTGPADGALVLVVEDNPEMNRFIVESLTDQHRVATAFDGKEGLARAVALKPDLVLTDIMMPEMSGDELVDAIRARPELASVPIIVLSARADDAIRVHLLREGAQDYLTKPFSVEELRARVANLVARKRAEELVRQAEAKYRGIISIAADAVISIDEEQRIVDYNEGASEVFGWVGDEILGKPLDALFPQRFRGIHAQHVRDFAAGATKARRMGERRPVFGLRKNGEEFPAEAAISKLRVGNGWLFTVILRDITDLKRAIQARDEVLGIVAHDLRNPVNAILMAVSLLRRPGAERDAASRTSVEAIGRSATRMNRLIRDLLDVTRLEASALSIEQAPVPAGRIVSESVEAQESLASSSSLGLRLDLAPDVPEVWADRDRLLQVFENLIGNAVKFTEPGGSITVGAAPRNGEVLFWVVDTGAGISIEDLPHVFDRFWQADKARSCGTGLGLPIVKGIVEAHGGRIWVQSRLGCGTTFLFTIPTAPQTERGRPEPAREPVLAGR